ncbi:hypothetical protein EBR21_15390, partial [bacterium]|nr:hypothetical protein [bacterium]
LSGRENVLLNLALLGVPRLEAIDAIPKVLAFADLMDFADEPVKNYSSGMQARLGFACATVFRPDVLIVDEVLAVGDENFQRRCIAHMHSLRRQGTSIVLVSHDLNTVEQFCQRVYLLDHGQVHFEGDPAKAVSEFRKLLLEADNRKITISNSPQAAVSGVPVIEEFVCIVRNAADESAALLTGTPWSIEVIARHASGAPTDNFTVGISVHESTTGTHLGGLMAKDAAEKGRLIVSKLDPTTTSWKFHFKSNPFHSGRYHVDLRTYRIEPFETLSHLQKLVSFDCRFDEDPANPHRNFIALGASL